MAAKDEVAALSRKFLLLLERLLTFPVPSVAAINGHAFGAGLMLACGTVLVIFLVITSFSEFIDFSFSHDYRVMASDAGLVCIPVVDIGILLPRSLLELARSPTLVVSLEFPFLMHLIL